MIPVVVKDRQKWKSDRLVVQSILAKHLARLLREKSKMDAHDSYELETRATATDRDEICVRQRGATEAYVKYAARSDEAAGRKYRPRCEQLREKGV